jgi:hypothetical protein
MGYRMYKNIIAIFFVLAVLISPAGAQMRSVGTTVSGPRSVGGVPYGYYNGYPNTYNNGAQYVNPYNTMYGGYSPYASAYQGQYNYGGMSAPVYGAPQLIRGNLYGINIGGRSSQLILSMWCLQIVLLPVKLVLQ